MWAGGRLAMERVRVCVEASAAILGGKGVLHAKTLQELSAAGRAAGHREIGRAHV